MVLNRLTKVTDAKRIVLGQGNRGTDLPMFNQCLNKDTEDSLPGTDHAVQGKPAMITTKALEEKELSSSGGTNQLERLCSGRYMPES